MGGGGKEAQLRLSRFRATTGSIFYSAAWLAEAMFPIVTSLFIKIASRSHQYCSIDEASWKCIHYLRLPVVAKCGSLGDFHLGHYRRRQKQTKTKGQLGDKWSCSLQVVQRSPAGLPVQHIAEETGIGNTEEEEEEEEEEEGVELSARRRRADSRSSVTGQKSMEIMGIDPMTSRMLSARSTTELYPRIKRSLQRRI